METTGTDVCQLSDGLVQYRGSLPVTSMAESRVVIISEGKMAQKRHDLPLMKSSATSLLESSWPGCLSVIKDSGLLAFAGIAFDEGTVFAILDVVGRSLLSVEGGEPGKGRCVHV